MTKPNAVLTAIALTALSLVAPNLASAHKGSPNYRSTVRSVNPRVTGLTVQVLNYDDRLSLINKTGRDVEIRGYGDEPYVKVLANGTVEVNKRSPSYYLNEDRFGNVAVPPGAKETAPPRWDVVDKTGRYEWHDHRIHFMSKSLPNQVADKGKRTKIFDWRVPIVVGGKRGALRGDLYWVPAAGGIPRGAIVALAVVVVAAILFVEIVRRRRRQRGGRRGASEAWG
jgi:hypothetical protein